MSEWMRRRYLPLTTARKAQLKYYNEIETRAILPFPPCWSQHHGSQPAKDEGDQVTKTSFEVDSLPTRQGNHTGQLYVADCS